VSDCECVIRTEDRPKREREGGREGTYELWWVCGWVRMKGVRE
jgi:hypothetical protein